MTPRCARPGGPPWISQWDEAEALYLGAAEALPPGPERVAAWEGAAHSAEMELRLADALAHLAALTREPMAEETAARVAATRGRLEALSGGAAPWTMAMDGALDPRVEVGEPWGVRRDGAGGLLLNASGEALLLALPVERVGEAVRVEARLELKRLEWAAGLSLNLETADGEVLLGTRLDARGGGQYVFPRLRCPSDGANAAIRGVTAQEAADEGGPLQLVVLASRGQLTCRALGSAQQEDGALGPSAWPPGPLRLTLRSHSIGDAHTQVIARLESVSAEGLVLASSPASEDPLSEARRLLADRQPGDALARLEGLERRDLAWLAHRFAALEDAGRAREAEDTLARLSAEMTMGERAALLRLHPDRWAPWFSANRPQEWIDLFYTAYRFALRQHPGDATLRSLLRRHLAVVDVEEEASEAVVVLLVARGEASLPDEPGRARSLLLRALALGEGLLAAAPTELVREQVVRAHTQLAAMAVASGGAEEAFEHLRAGLALSSAPELTADIYAVQEGLRPLHAEAAWADILAIRRGR
ncbi:MAG: hypothetical protein H6741_33595 [Alphaproteobacteria bacterium]|nr:hypothetical protein [Alphaproteobacteria bacterium]